MSTIKIPHNGLPQEIANIPFGQVIVLTDPNQGITSKTIKTVEFIHSVARKLNQKRHIVNSLPVDAADLWGCVICKVKTDDGVQILVSDWNSLLEMLCVFWELDYEEVCKIPDIIPGWHKTHKGVKIGGESHPVRVPVPARMPEMERLEDHSILLQCITVHTKEGEMAKIEDILEDALLHKLDISALDLITLLDKVSKKERKTYELDINIIPGDEGWDKDMIVFGPRRTCEITITDDSGIKHKKKLPAQTAALYLTFILFKDGIKIADLKTNNEFYNLFIHICKRLKSINKLPDQKTLWKNANRKRGEIKKAISDVTNDNKNAEMLFGIEGEEGKEFRVAGATDELREKIKKGFDIE
jgi:hypothetical protein